MVADCIDGSTFGGERVMLSGSIIDSDESEKLRHENIISLVNSVGLWRPTPDLEKIITSFNSRLKFPEIWQVLLLQVT